MEQNYSYDPLPPNTSSHPSSSQYRSISNGVADPRSLAPNPTTNGASTQPYTQTQTSPYPQPSYNIGIDYRTPQNPQYTHEQTLPLPSITSPMTQNYAIPATMDTTGQIAPPGMRPRLTTSIFEEEGSICFQVDCSGICVARREDNHMINGTKLLNVAGMTRGRRDGILKAEKQKNVVKIGPMHLKGVWIPFERALTLANQEKITEQLYPLFVHNIGALLYHPINAARPGPLPPLQHQDGPLPRLENMGEPLPRVQMGQSVEDAERGPRL